MTQRDEREKMLALADDIEDQAGRDIILHQPDRDLIIAALRTPTDGEAHAEIQRLQDAKRRALALADERAKENVALRAALAAPASEGVREAVAWRWKCRNAPGMNWICQNVHPGSDDGGTILIEPLYTAPEPADAPDEGPDPLGYAKGEK